MSSEVSKKLFVTVIEPKNVLSFGPKPAKMAIFKNICVFKPKNVLNLLPLKPYVHIFFVLIKKTCIDFA